MIPTLPMPVLKSRAKKMPDCDNALRRKARGSGFAFFILLSLVTLPPDLRSQPTWIQLHTPTSQTLRTVYFVDSFKGWAAGDSGTIIKTADGGLSWTTQNSGIVTPIGRLFMLNDRLGWALSITPWSGPSEWYGTTMLRTTDGGNVWSAQLFDSLFFYAVAYLDSLNGWIGGYNGKLMGTKDGGQQWFNANVPSSLSSKQPVHAIKFFSRSTGFAVGGAPDVIGVIWRTTDSGQHWTTSSVLDQLLSLDLSDSLHVLCVGGGFDDGPEVARTSDGGNSWQFRFTGFPNIYGYASSVAFRTSSEAWALMGYSGACMVTQDSGTTWTLTTIKKGLNLYDVKFTDPRHGHVGGASGAVFMYNAPSLVTVSQNWNIVSVPLRVPDYRKTVLFPSAISNAFGYTPSGYQPSDTLANHFGYWVKFPADQMVQIPGTPTFTDTFNVAGGWNMIGSITESIIPSAVHAVGVNVLSPFYGYHRGYSVADTLLPGEGYWVKVSASGSLILSFFSRTGKVESTHDNPLGRLNRLVFEDGSGDRQTLFFDTNPDGSSIPESYEMPPAPPEGAFDVRFASQRLVETANEERIKEIPILASSPAVFLSISWNLQEGPSNAHLKIDDRDIALNVDGSARVPKAAARILLELSPKDVPKEFMLYQNFPNPFNPTTDFGLRIANCGFVSLKIYDLLGREVATLVNEVRQPGEYAVRWDASNYPSGVYFYRLNVVDLSGSFTRVRKMLLLR